MARFNGHKNYNHWNVNLWLTSDEGLYRLMQAYARCPSVPLDKAAERMLDDLREMGVTHTPDGAPYSKTTIRAAMRFERS
jgi:hypothetical protein